MSDCPSLTRDGHFRDRRTDLLEALATELARLGPLVRVPVWHSRGVGIESAAEIAVEGDMRPCDFCGHPVGVDLVDEYDCRVCGEPLVADSGVDPA